MLKNYADNFIDQQLLVDKTVLTWILLALTFNINAKKISAGYISFLLVYSIKQHVGNFPRMRLPSIRVGAINR